MIESEIKEALHMIIAKELDKYSDKIGVDVEDLTILDFDVLLEFRIKNKASD